MKLHTTSRLGWFGLILFLCGVALLAGIASKQVPSIAAESGAARGVHLGNVEGGAWWDDMYFSRIRGGGNWPNVAALNRGSCSLR